MENPNSLVDLEGLSRALRISKRWLRRETVQGRIPYLRAGQRRVFNVHAVRASLAERAALAERQTKAVSL